METAEHPFEDYRHVLRHEYESRVARNPSYSMRAFARDLGISPACLSEVLAGYYGLSRKVADQITERLKYPSEKREAFWSLIESVHGRTELARQGAKTRLENYRLSAKIHQMQMDVFAVVAQWFHFAILELPSLGPLRDDPRSIADTLGISADEAEQAVERLIRVGQLERKDGELVPTQRFTASPQDIPSEAIREAHRGVLDKARSSLETQAVDEREFGSLILAIDRRKMDEAKKMIRDFQREFCRSMSASESKNDVYCLSTQFFSLKEKRS